MADPFESAPNLAVFCDFENVAIGAREANYGEFEISLVLERLLDMGQIIVKKASADWERFTSARRALHEKGFELIEIPYVSAMSGKNSADIRLVVDALDLCYTKAHVDVFAVISGDSDFSPLVAKLRENDKKVLGLGVKKSTSSLLVDGCDEFIYYDDLVREREAERNKRSRVRRGRGKKALPTEEARRGEALELVADVVEALLREREPPVFGSMVKQTLKRKRPTFSESFHGYRSFSHLLEDAQAQGLLELQKDPRAGGYLVWGLGPATAE